MHRHVRHFSYMSHRGYEEHYSYRSQSRSYYQGASDDQDADQTAQQSAAEGNAWVDGYGRSHYAVTASAAPDDRVRLAPWHGYDEKCDERK
jgi:hypothetical protein